MNNNAKQLNVLQIILLHLTPGLPVLAIAFILSSPYCAIGLPFVMSIYLSIALGLIPTQLLIMYFISRRSGRKIRDIVCFTEGTSFIRTVLWVLPLYAFMGFIFSALPDIEKPLWTMFNWVPDWFRINIDILKDRQSLILPTIILAFIFNGLFGPITEELYFRGFLLPRMSRMGKLAPIVNVVLFSIYHFFTPWENITRILAITPYVYAVWYKRNIRIGMIVHCLGNLTGILFTAMYLWS